MKKLLFATLLLVSITSIFAQQQSITTVLDGDSKETLPLLLGGILDPTDSSIIRSFQADDQGRIFHPETENENVIIQLRYLGYTTSNIFLAKGSKWPTVIKMAKSGITLSDVQVTGAKVPMAVKNDTVEFNAGAFKVRQNDMAEDLLKKLPGMQVEKDGTVKSQGEQITKITVDGKPFFGNDPLLATKNIPADAIDKVQVFDRKSDQSTFSGFEDNNTERSINISLKPDKRNARFGRIEAGVGNDDRYEASGTLFDFKDGRQVSILGMSNNVNKSGFTPDDAMAFNSANGGGGRGGARIGGQSVFSLLGANTIGINKNSTGGVNFRDSWNKLEMTGSYFFSDVNSTNSSETARETFLQTGSLKALGNSSSSSNDASHKVNLSFEYKLNENNSFKFEPGFNIGNNTYQSLALSNVKSSDGSDLNTSDAKVDSKSNNFSLQGNLLFRHKFATEGRTLSVNVNPRYSENKSTNYNRSNNAIFVDSLGSYVKDSINQQVANNQPGKGLGANLSYTEPLNKAMSLEFAYNYNYTKSDRNRTTNAFDPNNDTYNSFQDSLSNNFNNTYETHRPQLSLQIKNLKYVFTFTGAMQRAFLKSESLTENMSFNRGFTNFLPSVNAKFIMSKNKSFNVRYQTSTNQPSIDDIQPVPDLSDPLRIKIGNPDLGQEFTHSLRLNYRVFDMANNTFISLGLRGNYTNDKIVSNVSIDQYGVEISNKLNSNGVYSGTLWANYGRPYKKINLNVSSFTNYGRDLSYINNQENHGNNWSTTGRLTIGYNITDTWDINLGQSVSYNNSKYSLQSNLNNSYTDYVTDFSSTADLPFKLRVSTDLNYTQRLGLTGGFSRSFTLWNASLTRSFTSSNAFELSFYAFDLLGQNVAIDRNTSSFYIEDSRALTLSSYYMLTARYFLNKQKSKVSKTGRNFFRMMH